MQRILRDPLFTTAKAAGFAGIIKAQDEAVNVITPVRGLCKTRRKARVRLTRPSHVI